MNVVMVLIHVILMRHVIILMAATSVHVTQVTQEMEHSVRVSITFIFYHIASHLVVKTKCLI